ncbi:uncharacterized protein LOC126744757 [Anthonomus grandis grandis]|uniref:uncharacterized protein LOC126744757 n=1 Tax=Anthonomus grandis grandis TaxID=2921223 RepID=UPI0021659A81|nr:uncharacterized protein LOC126744757 [Anthonomus grandis grandis]
MYQHRWKHAELAAELENLTDEEIITGFSNDSINDRDFEPEESSSDSESDTEDGGNNSDDVVPLANLINGRRWKPVNGDRLTFDTFPNNTGVNPAIAVELAGKDPVDFFNYFINDDIINLFVTETNRFASQKIIGITNSGNQTGKERIAKWVDTNPLEMRKFLGIIIWMCLLQVPQLRDYWSKDLLYQNNISKIMSRNRFENILSMFHTCDNESPRDMKDK